MGHGPFNGKRKSNGKVNYPTSANNGQIWGTRGLAEFLWM
jgi:hypothetical protein